MGKEEINSTRGDKSNSKREKRDDYNRRHQNHSPNLYSKTIRPKSNTNHNNNNQFNELKELLVNKDQKINNLEKEIDELRRSRYNLTSDDRKGKYGYSSKFLTKRPGSSVKFSLNYNDDNSNNESFENFKKDDIDENEDPNDVNNVVRSCNISPKAKSRTESLRTDTSLATTNSTQVHRNNTFFKVIIVPFLQKIIKQFTSSLVFKNKALELHQRFNEMMDIHFSDYNKFNLLNDILEDFSFLNMQHIGLLNKEIQYEKASQVMVQNYNNTNNQYRVPTRGNAENYDAQDRPLPRTSGNSFNVQYGYQYMEPVNLENITSYTNNTQREPYNYSPSRKSFITQNQNYDFSYMNQYESTSQTMNNTTPDFLQRDNNQNNNNPRLDHTCGSGFGTNPPPMVSLRSIGDNIPSPVEKKFNKFNLKKNNNSKYPSHSHPSQSNTMYNFNQENM
ncbi:similar to Saccharomyces cerevisiae YGL170C SPO74 Component of the meiotic outer plaque of the spindle pole body [Maudiozyma saulgeensis]|uniref:Similar to Saccharomyces cerevisiae YGL170C SPO74 Component of the meiotic outer plaque of the spindle pole body n=1 Tax=Maudiozyma saulgeensis TaxID=1789683 RepID=A0A1X7QZ71_9SACH|nr:similar to Saccharomyces cerevisiae YGL170C SPO74 Component of the meiotic outer plaque of the spindle pole body [Kazachstania saulgeensis]